MTKRKASIANVDNNEGDQGDNSQEQNNNCALNANGSSNNVSDDPRSISDDTQHIVNNSDNNSNSGNDNSSNNSGNSKGNQQKSKKERADNWSSTEIQVLHRGIESRRDIFYGPPSQSTKKNRELAWESITKEVNAVSTTPRSLPQVMKKFKNEKCRAKRKFIDSDKDGHNTLRSNNGNISNISFMNSSATASTNSDNQANIRTQSHVNQQPQPQSQTHHMAGPDSMSTAQPSINVVKLAPQSHVAKTMIDLPGHVQQIQMPNDDMVLIVPPDMDGLLSGVNIVSDGNGNHFQKCSGNNSEYLALGPALNNPQHNHHTQHTIQTLNTGQGLVNGTMSNSMMARTIPAASMCSLVYSTGPELCNQEQHVGASHSALTSNHMNQNAQSLIHHRIVDQNQNHQHQSNHQLQHQQQQQQQPQHQQPQAHQQQQSQHAQHHQQATTQHHHQPHLSQNQLNGTTSSTANAGGGNAAESQLKNLLFNLLLKEGQHSSIPITNSNQDSNKQRNDMLAIIANSLSKIENHLSKISKVMTESKYTVYPSCESSQNVSKQT